MCRFNSGVRACVPVLGAQAQNSVVFLPSRAPAEVQVLLENRVRIHHSLSSEWFRLSTFLYFRPDVTYFCDLNYDVSTPSFNCRLGLTFTWYLSHSWLCKTRKRFTVR